MVIVGICGQAFAGKATLAKAFQSQGFVLVRIREDTALKTILNRYKQNIVIYPVQSTSQFQILSMRNHFTLVKVTASASNRLKRSELQPCEFMQVLDQDYTKTNLQKLLCQAKMTFNNDGNEADLRQTVVNNLSHMLRNSSLDQYYMSLAQTLRKRSNCMKSSVGAVLVGSDDTVLSCGHNGTPSGMQPCNEGGCDRCNQGVGKKELTRCWCMHAQELAILLVGKSKLKGSTIYTTLFPCFSCSKVISRAQIKRVVYKHIYDSSGKEQQQYGVSILKEAGVEISQISSD